MISHDPSHFAESELADYMDSARIALSITSCEEEDHPLIYVNQAFCDLTGYSRDNVLQRNCRFMQRELREQDGRFRMREFMRDKSMNFLRCALTNFRADGSPFVNLIYLSRIRSRDQKQCFIFASQFDATAQLSAPTERYEQDLRMAAGQLRHIVSDHNLMMDQTVDTVANSASMIAQSKMILKNLQTGA